MPKTITLESLDRRVDDLARMTQKEFTAIREELANFVTKNYLAEALRRSSADTIAAIEGLLDHKLERVEQDLKLERRVARLERQLGIER